MATKHKLISKKNHPHFSFIESLIKTGRDPYRDYHFQQVMDDIKRLEQWMKDHRLKNKWTLTEKLAFLRNVESTIRTGAAVRRTQLSWFTLVIATLAASLAFLLRLSGKL